MVEIEKLKENSHASTKVWSQVKTNLIPAAHTPRKAKNAGHLERDCFCTPFCRVKSFKFQISNRQGINSNRLDSWLCMRSASVNNSVRLVRSLLEVLAQDSVITNRPNLSASNSEKVFMNGTEKSSPNREWMTRAPTWKCPPVSRIIIFVNDTWNSSKTSIRQRKRISFFGKKKPANWFMC
jgi:tRNA(Leu) C34 or U34 (ribose-2'-O)-methylase TrmL